MHLHSYDTQAVSVNCDKLMQIFFAFFFCHLISNKWEVEALRFILAPLLTHNVVNTRGEAAVDTLQWLFRHLVYFVQEPQEIHLTGKHTKKTQYIFKIKLHF